MKYPNVVVAKDSVVRILRNMCDKKVKSFRSIKVCAIVCICIDIVGFKSNKKLTAYNIKKLVSCASGFLTKVPDLLNNLWFSDEAHILLSGHVSSKDKICWGNRSPRFLSPKAITQCEM